MKAKEEPSAKMLLCSHCPKEFRYKSEKKRHELSHFPHFECETCNKKFSFVSALRRHQKQHERTGSVKCEECHRKFKDDILLKRHMQYAHKGTFICDECKSAFCSDLALRTHMKTHKPESERRFKCGYRGCTKSFNFSHHLKHHELTHTNAKQYYCRLCGKGFIQSHHLKTHMKAHDPGEWLCCESPGCKKTFSTDYARRRHMVTHRNKPDSGISSDSNSCDASITSKESYEENILCGDTILQNEHQNHSKKCTSEGCDTADIAKQESDNIIEERLNIPFEPSVTKEKTCNEDSIEERGGDSDMSGCCMASIENCEYTQTMPTIKEKQDVTHNENNNIDNSGCINELMSRDNITDNSLHDEEDSKISEDSKLDIIKLSPLTDYSVKDMCEGCDCVNICNKKISMYLAPEVPTLAEPSIVKTDTNVEYRIDGVIKIKDLFDVDIVLKKEKDNSKRSIPFSTCKDVIGNCLVNNKDGCLCARMMADEEQAILAQEIDDITPWPKIEGS